MEELSKDKIRSLPGALLKKIHKKVYGYVKNSSKDYITNNQLDALLDNFIFIYFDGYIEIYKEKIKDEGDFFKLKTKIKYKL